MSLANTAGKGDDNNYDIPVIDISMFDETTDGSAMSTVAANVAEACQNSGFFFLKPSPKTQVLVSGLIDHVRSFFALPLIEKQKLKNDEITWHTIGDRKIPGTGPGYRGFGADPNFAQDTRESYNFGAEAVVCNKWPSEELLPKMWKKYLEEYTEALLSTSVILRRLIALALGQDMKVFGSPGYFDKPMWLVGMVHYASTISNVQENIHGIRPHCDGGIFTLLVTDGQPGLQICLDKTKPIAARTWIDVPPAPAAHFTVNLGKNLERLSNGLFKATMHQVVNTTGKERFSSPFFYDTNIDALLAPFPECCVQFPAQYSPTTPAQLSIQRLSAKDEQFE